MSAITAYISENYKKKNGTTPIILRFYINRQKIKISTGISIEKSKWDAENQQIKGVGKEAKDNNLIIKNLISRINNIFVTYRLGERRITKEIFLREFNSNSKFSDIWAFVDSEIEKRKGLISKNTYKAHKSTIKKFIQILPNLQFHEFNEETIRDIKKLLKSKFNNNQNTIAKNLITLKTYVSIAIRKKYIDEDPFRIEKIKRSKSNQVWLTDKELNKLVEFYRQENLPSNLNRVLQYFLFSCFTGFRLSDVKEFRMEQVKGDFILINPIKTKRVNNEMVTIPLTKPIKKLLKEVAPHRVEGRVFDCFADQVTNRMLKKISELAGINKDISFHSARHTFATYFLEKTDDLATLQKLLGHSDIKQTMIYVHLTEGKKVAQMHKSWNEFNF